MTTVKQIEATIAATTHEIQKLKMQNGRIPTLRHELAAATSNHALNPTELAHSRLQRLSDELAEAAKAQEQLSIKQAALGMLEQELQQARSDERRLNVLGITQNFDNLKARYEQDAQALLSLFRQMDHLHRQHLGITGQALLWERDYTLNLPSTNSPNDAAWATTGSMVRA